MKKIINGRMYDTSTAKLIGDWNNGHFTNNFAYCSECLYQKKTGEFFLHASYNGNSASWGEKIIPISYEEAQKWAEEKLDAERYINTFGEPEEKEEKVQLKIYVSNVTLSKIKQNASRSGKTLSQYVENMLINDISL